VAPPLQATEGGVAYIQYVYVTWRVDPEPRDAQLAKGFANARRALLHLGRYEEALPSFEACARRALAFGHWRRYMAAALAQLGQLDEARAALRDAASTRGYASIEEIQKYDGYMDGLEFDRLIEGLRKAGLPEV
jgi:hypothetical protein